MNLYMIFKTSFDLFACKVFIKVLNNNIILISSLYQIKMEGEDEKRKLNSDPRNNLEFDGEKNIDSVPLTNFNANKILFDGYKETKIDNNGDSMTSPSIRFMNIKLVNNPAIVNSENEITENLEEDKISDELPPESNEGQESETSTFEKKTGYMEYSQNENIISNSDFHKTGGSSAMKDIFQHHENFSSDILQEKINTDDQENVLIKNIAPMKYDFKNLNKEDEIDKKFCIAENKIPELNVQIHKIDGLKAEKDDPSKLIYALKNKKIVKGSPFLDKARETKKINNINFEKDNSQTFKVIKEYCDYDDAHAIKKKNDDIRLKFKKLRCDLKKPLENIENTLINNQTYNISKNKPREVEKTPKHFENSTIEFYGMIINKKNGDIIRKNEKPELKFKPIVTKKNLSEKAKNVEIKEIEETKETNQIATSIEKPCIELKNKMLEYIKRMYYPERVNEVIRIYKSLSLRESINVECLLPKKCLYHNPYLKDHVNRCARIGSIICKYGKDSPLMKLDFTRLTEAEIKYLEKLYSDKKIKPKD